MFDVQILRNFVDPVFEIRPIHIREVFLVFDDKYGRLSVCSFVDSSPVDRAGVRAEFATTNRLLVAMASAASSGFNRPASASGIASPL
jgi:hypothetical protein